MALDVVDQRSDFFVIALGNDLASRMQRKGPLRRTVWFGIDLQMGEGHSQPSE
jgi:hypothetical protein